MLERSPSMSEHKQLLEMLRDVNPAVRRFALQRLGETGERHLLPEIRRATEDEDAGVASQAEKSLYLILQNTAALASVQDWVAERL